MKRYTLSLIIRHIKGILSALMDEYEEIETNQEEQDDINQNSD